MRKLSLFTTNHKNKLLIMKMQIKQKFINKNYMYKKTKQNF